MKKRRIVPLLLLLMAAPAASDAQELPQLLAAARDGLTQGLETGAAMAYAAMSQELTLEIMPESTRIEAGKPLSLTVAAGNPRPQDTAVTITLKLPDRLSSAQGASWEAVLPAAQIDPQSGELVPSVTVFTREIVLAPGGDSEQTEISAELAMGTRFYRASTPVELCVPDVSVSAAALGAENRLRAGDEYAYELKVVNAGSAPENVLLEMVLPQDVTLTQALPDGFALEKGIISGHVRAEAAQQSAAGMIPFETVIRLPVRIRDEALDGDEDASKLLTGALRAGGERVPLPRVQVCGARISAQLVADTDSLKAGETAAMRLVVVNAGLVPADVRLSCVLPQGLRLADDEETATPAEAGAVVPPQDGGNGSAAVPAGRASEPVETVMSREARTLVFDLHMDAASEKKSGVSAETKVIELTVEADTELDNLKEKLVSTALAWTVDGGETRLGDAVAMRVYRPAFAGIAGVDWNGIFWATALLMVTVGLLYAAVKSENREEDFCCE